VGGDRVQEREADPRRRLPSGEGGEGTLMSVVLVDLGAPRGRLDLLLQAFDATTAEAAGPLRLFPGSSTGGAAPSSNPGSTAAAAAAAAPSQPEPQPEPPGGAGSGEPPCVGGGGGRTVRSMAELRELTVLQLKRALKEHGVPTAGQISQPALLELACAHLLAPPPPPPSPSIVATAAPPPAALSAPPSQPAASGGDTQTPRPPADAAAVTSIPGLPVAATAAAAANPEPHADDDMPTATPRPAADVVTARWFYAREPARVRSTAEGAEGDGTSCGTVLGTVQPGQHLRAERSRSVADGTERLQFRWPLAPLEGFNPEALPPAASEEAWVSRQASNGSVLLQRCDPVTTCVLEAGLGAYCAAVREAGYDTFDELELLKENLDIFFATIPMSHAEQERFRVALGVAPEPGSAPELEPEPEPEQPEQPTSEFLATFGGGAVMPARDASFSDHPAAVLAVPCDGEGSTCAMVPDAVGLVQLLGAQMFQPCAAQPPSR
jgi:hypothetical protein